MINLVENPDFQWVDSKPGRTPSFRGVISQTLVEYLDLYVIYNESRAAQRTQKIRYNTVNSA